MTEEPEIEENQIQDNLGDELEENIPFQYAITSYGADYTVDGLVKRMREQSIIIPNFQRDYVWRYRQGSRFIESLLLGLPIPGIFFSKEAETQKLLVIDGQQRLRTLQYFYEGIFEPSKEEFALRGVQPQFKELSYKRLKAEDRRMLDDSIIHATIVKQDTPSEDDSSIYHIFERLNTGGTQLKPQQIRASIFHGEFIEALKVLNKNSAWRSIYGRPSPEMRDQELILRFLALYYYQRDYQKPMKGFLNRYMGKNRHLTVQTLIQLTQAFEPTIELIHESIGLKAFKPQKVFNAAIFDAVMIGVSERLKKGDRPDKNEIVRSYNALLENQNFNLTTGTNTADDLKVFDRLDLAKKAFALIK